MDTKKRKTMKYAAILFIALTVLGCRTREIEVLKTKASTDSLAIAELVERLDSVAQLKERVRTVTEVVTVTEPVEVTGEPRDTCTAKPKRYVLTQGLDTLIVNGVLYSYRWKTSPRTSTDRTRSDSMYYFERFRSWATDSLSASTSSSDSKSESVKETKGPTLWGFLRAYWWLLVAALLLGRFLPKLLKLFLGINT